MDTIIVETMIEGAYKHKYVSSVYPLTTARSRKQIMESGLSGQITTIRGEDGFIVERIARNMLL